MIREMVVNGQFYPKDKKKLSEIIESFTTKELSRISAKAIILPHAGYVYSGNVAVATVNKILPKKRLIILGPKHTAYGEGFALWRKGKWKIPFGEIEIDEEMADLILTSGDYIKEDYLAHNEEHSIEVELPILHCFFKDFKFVPIACQVSDINTYKNVASQIYRAVKRIKDDVLFVASTDMTHYEPDSTARKKDRDAIENIINLDCEGLVKKVKKENITMCGIAPVAILIACMKDLGAKKAHVSLYQTSGDVSGDYSSVVGYVGVIIN
jgi:AmmeMemoRadiSam system protein B